MKRVVISLLWAAGMLSCAGRGNTKEKAKNDTAGFVVIGYVAGYNGLIETRALDVAKLTHINYAFVDVKDNRAWLHHEETDTTNFRMLNLLKKINPGLKIMISIGGWSWSRNFSDAALTESSRKTFASSSAGIIHQYDLDGIDIDWEYPNMRGDGNVFRPEDKQNYTLMFAELRHALDSLQTLTNRKYQLTTAVGGFPEFIRNTEMAKAQQYLDYVNIMTYDYSWGVAGHHTNLYASVDSLRENSADKAVKDYMAAGVPPAKLVMGLAFFGRGGIVSTANNHGFNQKIILPANGGGFTYLKDSLIGQKGFVRYWDENAQAPYLFNDSTKHFISYDDETSVRIKSKYVLYNQLGGVMFWEYSSDPKGYLLKIVHKVFNPD